MPVSFRPHDEHSEFVRGKEDGMEGRPFSADDVSEVNFLEYQTGYDIGFAVAHGDVEPLTTEEMREVYGDDGTRDSIN